MTKLLHTADLHLDSPLKSLALRDPGLRDAVHVASRAALTRIVDIALEQEVAALLIAGDLFDGKERSARTAAFLIAELDRLRAAGIRVVCIKGNHDAENPLTGETDWPDNVHVFDGRGGKLVLGETGIVIHGVSFSGRHAPDSLLDKFPAPEPGAVNIAMLHTSLSGAEGHDPYAPCTVAELQAMGFDYWALGHVHKRQVHGTAPWIVMPGTPQGRDMGETGTKSATLLTVTPEGITAEEIPTSEVAFQRIAIDISEVAGADALRDLLRQRLEAEAGALRSDSAILRITLTGATGLKWPLTRDLAEWDETLRTLAAQTGRLWLDRLELEVTAPAAGATGTATDELAVLMDGIAAEDAFLAETANEIRDLLMQLPPSQRKRLLPDEDAPRTLARQLAREGAEHVVALMKAHGS